MNLPNIEDLTQDQRRQLLVQLLEKNVAGPVRVNEDGGAVLPMNSYDLVQPGQQVTISTQVFSPFDLKKIVILEPVLGRTPGQIVFVPPSVQRLFGPRLLDLDEEVEKPVDKSQEQSVTQPWSVVPRGCWEIVAVFLGANSLFGSMGKISGDAFAPDGKLDFASETCQTGICISLVVQHSLAEAVPFRAVAIGKLVKEQVPLNQTKLDPSFLEEFVKRMQQPSGAGLLPTRTINTPNSIPISNPPYDWFPQQPIYGGPDDFGGSDYTSLPFIGQKGITFK